MIVIAKEDLTIPDKTTGKIIWFYEKGKHYKAYSNGTYYLIIGENKRRLPMKLELLKEYFRIFSK